MNTSSVLHVALPYLWIIPVVLVLLFYRVFLRIFGVIIIAEDEIGIVSKKFVLFGQNRSLPDGAIVALKGEAGKQADTLAPGVHFWYWPWQYEILREEFTVVSEKQLGLVEAVDGRPLADGDILGRKVDCDSFQNARAFLENGGQRGPQIAVITPGTYRINTSLFKVRMVDVTEIPDNKVGIVTTKAGKPLRTGDIAGEEIQGHNLYQDGQAFLNNGGYKGLQEQVILAGRYFINPMFATVETKDMSEVPIAHVGVIISYVGKEGQDVTGSDFKHGNLVGKGQKGVLAETLDPGKYPLNNYTHKIENVPTANIVLNWATGKTESHNLDKNLSTITVRSSDGFTFNLDVSQIIHIPSNDAPKVIARFGSVGNMVTQVLEPTIGNYFRNAAQGSDVISFLKERETRQEDAKKKITEALLEYNVVAVDTLIGDIVPPEELMKTLTDRKIAEQKKETYNTQKLAEEARKELQEASAIADIQKDIVKAERQVQIAEYEANSTVKKAEGDAKSKTINAKADAEVTEVTGIAKGKSITAIGGAEAEVIQKKTAAVGQSNFALIEVAKVLAENNIKLVPEIFVGGTSGSSSGNLVDVLVAKLAQKELAKTEEPKEISETAVAEIVVKTEEASNKAESKSTDNDEENL